MLRTVKKKEALYEITNVVYFRLNRVNCGMAHLESQICGPHWLYINIPQGVLGRPVVFLALYYFWGRFNKQLIPASKIFEIKWRNACTAAASQWLMIFVRFMSFHHSITWCSTVHPCEAHSLITHQVTWCLLELWEERSFNENEPVELEELITSLFVKIICLRPFAKSFYSPKRMPNWTLIIIHRSPCFSQYLNLKRVKPGLAAPGPFHDHSHRTVWPQRSTTGSVWNDCTQTYKLTI